jgi:two-component system, chemotaxis family, protein-glutamate methylesterase/glutaminase
MKKVRALIVDDSATMRQMIAAVLRRDPEIEVVGVAGDPFEALRAIKLLQPDVLTLDIEMPRRNGRDFLKRLMRIRPMPIVMVSVHTTEGAQATRDVMALGAFGWASANVQQNFDTLPEKVKTAARARQAGQANGRFNWNGKLVAIGASAGGVESLMKIVSRFPAQCPATLIVQHIPPTFVRGLVLRMNSASRARVSEAVNGTVLEPGFVYIAPAGQHLEVATGPSGQSCRLRGGEPVNGFMPSIDVLFRSLARNVGARAVGVILSGLGRDGVQGLLEMREAGARTLGQDWANAVPYAMPKAAFEIGAVERQVPCDRMASEILDRCNAAPGRLAHA